MGSGLGGAAGQPGSTPADKRSCPRGWLLWGAQASRPTFARAKHSLQKRTFVGGNSRSRTCLSSPDPIPVRRSVQKTGEGPYVGTLRVGFQASGRSRPRAGPGRPGPRGSWARPVTRAVS